MLYNEIVHDVFPDNFMGTIFVILILYFIKLMVGILSLIFT